MLSQGGLKFRALHPVFGRRDKPLPLSEQQRSVYYWWWAYLRRNKQYLACCERGGEGRLATLYKDFDDVRSDDFRKWWLTHNRGGYLFAEPLAPVRVSELATKADWDDAWSAQATMVVVVPLDWSKRAIQKSFASLLAKRHSRGRGKLALKGAETSAARYPLTSNFNIHSLNKGLEVYDAVEAARAMQGKRKTFYEIGCELRLVPSALPTREQIATGIRDADRVNVMNVAVSRYYKRAAAMVASTAKGVFPHSRA